MAAELEMGFCKGCGKYAACDNYRGLPICRRSGCWRARKRLHAVSLYTRRVVAK